MGASSQWRPLHCAMTESHQLTRMCHAQMDAPAQRQPRTILADGRCTKFGMFEIALTASFRSLERDPVLKELLCLWLCAHVELAIAPTYNATHCCSEFQPGRPGQQSGVRSIWAGMPEEPPEFSSCECAYWAELLGRFRAQALPAGAIYTAH